MTPSPTSSATSTSSRGDEAVAAAAAAFHDLHRGPAPLRLVNAWDALSARVFALAGAPAIATSSFAVALSHGYDDGQHVPWSTVTATVREIVGATDVPVTVDIEAGQGSTPDAVASAVADVLDAGAVGINLEDGVPGSPGELFDEQAQADRIAAARATADRHGIRLFVNARTDVFFGAAIPAEDQADAVVRRARHYVDAGADGIFVPGLVDRAVLEQVTGAVTEPINVMLWPGLPPLAELTAVGVRRISQGAGTFLVAAGQLEAMTRAYLEGEPDQFGGEATPAYHLLGDLSYR